MSSFIIRRMQLTVEEVLHDGGPAPRTPRHLGAVLACVRNPCAGRYEADLQPMMDELKPLGREMSERLIDALGGAASIDGYGKGAVVGEAGELEHGALWHVPGGYAMRGLLGQCRCQAKECQKCRLKMSRFCVDGSRVEGF